MLKKYMLYQAIVILLLELMIISSCTYDLTPPDKPINKKIEVNGTWTYKIRSINIGIKNFPDTLTSYSISTCYCDTTINNKKYFAFQERVYSPDFFDVDTFSSRFYVYYGTDSVNVLQKNGNYPLIGIGRNCLNKVKMDHNLSRIKSLNRNFHYLVSEKIGKYFGDRLQYGDSVFNFSYYPVIFPLEIGKTWYYVGKIDSHTPPPIRRKYLGNETMSVPGGIVDAWKIEWDWSLWFPEFDLVGYDWWTQFGIVKQYFDYGNWTQYIVDEDGILDSNKIHSYQVSEYYGEQISKLPPPVPLLSDKKIADAKSCVSQNWDYTRFRAWFDTMVSYAIDKPEYESELELLQMNTQAFIEVVWGDSGVPYDSLVTYLNTHSLPVQEKDFKYYYSYLHGVIGGGDYMQGWIDCDFDWRKSDKPFVKTTGFFFLVGKSKIRRELEEYLFWD